MATQSKICQILRRCMANLRAFTLFCFILQLYVDFGIIYGIIQSDKEFNAFGSH